MHPIELSQKAANTLGITWDDGHQSSYQVRGLRLQCKCAACVDEWTRKVLIKEEQIPLDIRPKKIEPVGRYALSIAWSDGHSSGIYTFDHLRSLCECEACRKT